MTPTPKNIDQEDPKIAPCPKTKSEYQQETIKSLRQNGPIPASTDSSENLFIDAANDSLVCSVLAKILKMSLGMPTRQDGRVFSSSQRQIPSQKILLVEGNYSLEEAGLRI
jgi:hypothetical protein